MIQDADAVLIQPFQKSTSSNAKNQIEVQQNHKPKKLKPQTRKGL